MASLRLPILFYSILVDATQAACSCAYAKRLLLVWSAIGSETEARLVSRRAHFRYLCLMIIIEPLPLSLSYLPRLASPRLALLCLVPRACPPYRTCLIYSSRVHLPASSSFAFLLLSLCLSSLSHIRRSATTHQQPSILASEAFTRCDVVVVVVVVDASVVSADAARSISSPRNRVLSCLLRLLPVFIAYTLVCSVWLVTPCPRPTTRAAPRSYSPRRPQIDSCILPIQTCLYLKRSRTNSAARWLLVGCINTTTLPPQLNEHQASARSH